MSFLCKIGNTSLVPVQVNIYLFCWLPFVSETPRLREASRGLSSKMRVIRRTRTPFDRWGKDIEGGLGSGICMGLRHLPRMQSFRVYFRVIRFAV